mgnify:CR=1 FL=1
MEKTFKEELDGFEDGFENNPSCMRLIDKKDIHTLKTIQIIGKEKYEELLKAGIVAISYNSLRFYQLSPEEQHEEYRKEHGLNKCKFSLLYEDGTTDKKFLSVKDGCVELNKSECEILANMLTSNQELEDNGKVDYIFEDDDFR